jgi:hypothetical protein
MARGLASWTAALLLATGEPAHALAARHEGQVSLEVYPKPCDAPLLQALTVPRPPCPRARPPGAPPLPAALLCRAPAAAAATATPVRLPSRALRQVSDDWANQWGAAPRASDGYLRVQAEAPYAGVRAASVSENLSAVESGSLDSGAAGAGDDNRAWLCAQNRAAPGCGGGGGGWGGYFPMAGPAWRYSGSDAGARY